MHFVGNNAWFAALLVIHVIGAIAGIGPAFTFGLLGSMIPTAGGQQGATAIIRAIRRIERAMLRPVTLTTQWLTGVGLIYNRGLNHDFFSGSKAWLSISILLYVVLLLLGELLFRPTMDVMLSGAESGDMATVAKMGERIKKVGPIPPVLTLAIIVLMTWKPGSGCPTLSC